MVVRKDEFIKELPESLEAHKVGEQIIMKLDAVKEFFNINFRKMFFKIIL